MKNDVLELKKSLMEKATEERRLKVMYYFKTGKGEYGEGDTFLGISNPDLRECIKPYLKKISLEDLQELLKSKEHEFRLAALLIFVDRYRKNSEEREEIVNIYTQSTRYINNWDLVDCSAHNILGPWLSSRPRDILYEFATSGDLWEERISIMSTLHFIIKEREFEETLKLAKILLTHKHDLIHKAVGWMLREIGKISMETEEKFLKEHYKVMPRTMLRYAIEKFPEELRQDYLKGRV